MQRGLQTVDGEVGPLVLNALVSGPATVLGTPTQESPYSSASAPLGPRGDLGVLGNAGEAHANQRRRNRVRELFGAKVAS